MGSKNPAYPRPSPPNEVLPGQQSLFGEGTETTAGAPDPTTEAKRKRVLNQRLSDLKADARRKIWAIEIAETLLDRGITMPDLAEAAGLSPPVDRMTKPLKPWRLRIDSNMDVIAHMLEDAGRKGVSEEQMVEHLRSLGRLQTAKEARRSVHWTVIELRNRTKFAFQKAKSDGGKWYAYGRFDVWRLRSAHSSQEHKT